MILLGKLPVPVPLVVLLLAVVGFADVLQQTPRDAMVAPPSEVIFPPLEAVVEVIDVKGVVLTVGDVVSVATADPRFTLGLVMATFVSVMLSPVSISVDWT